MTTTIQPIRKLRDDEALTGTEHTIDGRPAWEITATGTDGRSATLWAVPRRTRPHAPVRWHVTASRDSRGHISTHRTFEAAARAANVRARRYLAAGRRISRQLATA